MFCNKTTEAIIYKFKICQILATVVEMLILKKLGF